MATISNFLKSNKKEKDKTTTPRDRMKTATKPCPEQQQEEYYKEDF